MKVALGHYVNHGRCFAFILRRLGYPCRQKLSKWVRERYPEARKCVVGKAGRPAASLVSEQAAACREAGQVAEALTHLMMAPVNACPAD